MLAVEGVVAEIAVALSRLLTRRGAG